MRRNKKGFTLIELLLVIAILGILIALILPRFEDIRTNANTKVCVGNLRGLANAMSIYETAKNTTVTWSSFRPENMVQWQYLAVAPYCPYAPSSSASSDRYSLSESTATQPDNAACPYAGTNADHRWP